MIKHRYLESWDKNRLVMYASEPLDVSYRSTFGFTWDMNIGLLGPSPFSVCGLSRSSDLVSWFSLIFEPKMTLKKQMMRDQTVKKQQIRSTLPILQLLNQKGFFQSSSF